MNYYFNIDGHRAGPFSDDQIRDQVVREKINQESLAWKEGMSEWAAVKNVPELMAAFPAIPAAPPPLPGASVPPPLPEVAGAQGYAEFGPRLLAGLIDGLILLIPYVVAGSIIPFVGGLLVGLGYYLYFMSESGGGQTIGYKAMKIKLVGEGTGQPVPMGGPLVLWYLVLAFVGFIGWIWYFTDEKHRMLHNIASNTVVIKVA